MEKRSSAAYPPWFEATPIYDIIPQLHNIKKEGIRIRRSPQTRADFLITFANDAGPCPPAMVDVKAKRPFKWSSEWGWEIIAAMRRGFIFQLAYPKEGTKYPQDMEEWEIATPCSNCKKLSKHHIKCSECNTDIYPFTIVDAYYKSKGT